MFGVTRIPNLPGDTLQFQYPTKSKRVIVLVDDQIYWVQVIHETGDLYSRDQIEIALRKVLQLHSKVPKQAPVGVLTGEHRDVWTKAYGLISKESVQNQESLKRISDSLFAMSLDNICPVMMAKSISYVIYKLLTCIV